MKAMILAAGRGERMRPLTDRTPKPMIPVGGIPLIDRHLRALADAGFSEVVINIAWLGEQIRDHVGDGDAWRLRVVYSDEGRQPLETAGGIRRALRWLGSQPFVVVNGDIVTDYPFERLAQYPLAGDLAHLVLVPNPPERSEGDFALARGRVRSSGSPGLTFAGLGVYDPTLFNELPDGQARLAPILGRAIAGDRVSGERYDGLWHDVGTPQRLEAAETALAHSGA